MRSRSLKFAAKSITGTPQARALRALPLMASGSEATTALVLRLTDDIGRGPSASASRQSWSRLTLGASPVKTEAPGV